MMNFPCFILLKAERNTIKQSEIKAKGSQISKHQASSKSPKMATHNHEWESQDLNSTFVPMPGSPFAYCVDEEMREMESFIRSNSK